MSRIQQRVCSNLDKPMTDGHRTMVIVTDLSRKLLWFMFLVIGLGSPAYGAYEAFVDRDHINTMETLTLTLRTDESNNNSRPDFNPVLDEFVIVSGPSQSSRTQIINGQVDSHIEFSVEIKPRRQGELVIPPIRWGSFVSDPIRIRVSEPTADQKRKMNEFIFFETEVDADTVFVQAQLIYTVRFFSASSIDRDFIEAPSPADAVVRTIEDDRIYSTIRNNRRYNVLEKKYAIFPQKSGEMEISPETFVGQVREGGVFSRGRQVTTSSEGHRIKVLPKPDKFPGDIWLPAKSLTLTAGWSTKPPVFKVGEPINLNLVIKADQVAASQLPPLGITELENAKVYADPAQTAETVSSDGVSSTRTETIGIVPTREGKLVIPEVKLQWWNTETNKVQTATLPSSTYTVLPGTQAFTPPPVPQIAQPGQTARAVVTDTQGYWMYVAAALALCWLLTVLLWVRAAQQLRQLNLAQRGSIKDDKPSEKELFKNVLAACHANDPTRVRLALLTWANARWPERRIWSIKDLHFLGDGFTAQVEAMNNQLYSPTASKQWNGAQLASLMDQLGKSLHQEKKPKDNGIEVLNP